VPSPWVLLQHVAYEGPGLIAPVAAAAGVELSTRRLYLGEPVPGPDQLADIGGLIVMGGPMSVWHDRDFAHLSAERALLTAALAADLPVLGVCLGAQLLAAAAGARVWLGTAGAEIGLGSVDLTADGRRDPVLGPAGLALPVVHWHGDTFELPTGATHLATTSRYAAQAFRLGRCAYGLQFHVEIDPAAANEMQPHLPDGVVLERRHLALVTRAGTAVLRRFFGRALESSGSGTG
jgi:GMP synthase (glutamine-hydrolysing)